MSYKLGNGHPIANERKGVDKMNRHKSMLLVGVAFILAISFAVNPTSAASRPRRGSWSGMQIPDPSQSLEEITYIDKPNCVVVKGARMVNLDVSTTTPTPDPYDFGVVQVYSETIDWMIIFADPEEFWADPQSVAANAKRVGRFTWHDMFGNKVAEGGFRFSPKDGVGYLWAKGDGFVAKGSFEATPFGVQHTGWYMFTD